MARPQKSGENKRDEIIRVRLTHAEKTQLINASAEHGVTVSDFIRHHAMKATPLYRKATPERAAFIKALADLGKVGSNVNQIARALNRRDDAALLDVSPELIAYALQGVDTLTRNLINLLSDGN